jgi:hypothetical protein
MFFLSRRWTVVVTLATVVKIVLIILTPPVGEWGDFYNWVLNSQQVLLVVSSGHLASLWGMGAYLGLSVLVSPLLWLWSALPTQHIALGDIAAHPSLSHSFLLVMKLPILALDITTGLLVRKLVHIHDHTLTGTRAFLAWYLNPYTWVWLYWYSTYDIIPTAIVTLSVLVAMKGRWFQSGICLSVACLLRLFPALIFPFFLVFANRTGRQSVLRVVLGFIAPLIAALMALSVATGSTPFGLLSESLGIPLRQPWLLDFYGFSITDSSISLTPFFLLVQLYLVLVWKNKRYSLMHGTLVSLLAVFVGAYHHGYHFLWASPFLTSHLDLDRATTPLYVLTYILAFFSPISYEGGVIVIFDPHLYPLLALGLTITGGAFVACKAFYLLRINTKAISVA